MVNVSPFDVPEEVDTVIVALPSVAMSLAGIEAATRVLLTKVVLRAAPFQLTVVGLTKIDPFTVRVKAPPPAVADDGLRLLMVGVAATTVTLMLLESAGLF
jgi:hypothetical protein